MKKNISQRDIAKILDVNVSTVSWALKGLPGVSSELRQEILRLAEMKGYRPNPFAMSLRYATTHTIRIVVPDMSFSHYAHIVKWIVAEARKKGYMCVLTDSGDKYDNEVECIEHLLNMRLQATLIHIDDMIYGETGIELIDTYYGKLAEMTHDEKVKNDKIGIKPGRRGHYGQSFWIPIKHVIRLGDAEEEGGSFGSGHRLNNIIIMRYAEVLLNYAECCLRTNDAASAKTYINQIQERAGSKTVSSSVDLVTLKKEKSFELWFEGCRYQDLMRWSKIDNDSYTKECMDHLKSQGKHVPNLCDKLSEMPDAVEAN